CPEPRPGAEPLRFRNKNHRLATNPSRCARFRSTRQKRSSRPRRRPPIGTCACGRLSIRTSSSSRARCVTRGYPPPTSTTRCRGHAASRLADADAARKAERARAPPAGRRPVAAVEHGGGLQHARRAGPRRFVARSQNWLKKVQTFWYSQLPPPPSLGSGVWGPTKEQNSTG